MQNPSCIDLLLTNNAYAFQQTIATCAGLSGCQKLFLTVLKTTVPRIQPKQITNTEITNNLRAEKCSYKRKY